MRSILDQQFQRGKPFSVNSFKGFYPSLTGFIALILQQGREWEHVPHGSKKQRERHMKGLGQYSSEKYK